MLLKMKNENGWLIVQANDSVRYSHEQITESGGVTGFTECVISVWQDPKLEPTPYRVVGEVYLLNDKGETIERIN